MKELRETRKAAGLTQKQIAKRMGVCQQRIAQIEGDELVNDTTESQFRQAVHDAVAERLRLSELLKAARESGQDFANRKTGER